MALAADRSTDQQLAGMVRRWPQAAVKCWQGGLVAVNAAGYATPAADTAGSKGVVGVSHLTSAAPNGAGDNDIEVLTGLFLFDATSITQAMVGQTMYVVDDHTFDESMGTNGVKAGILVKFVSTTSGWLLITGKPPGVGAVTADADATYGTAEANLINEIKTVLNTLVG